MASASSRFDRDRRRFVLRKLHSLSGVVPLGLFLILHLVTNARALSGQGNFDEAVKSIQDIPYLVVVEILFILLPLVFHAGYGVLLSFQSRANVGAYPFNRNWMYLAQRVTGILAFAFIGWHLSQFWYQKMAGKMSPDQFYGALCEQLSTPTAGLPLTALGYVFGVGVTVFHFANGLWGFCTSWGITPTRRSQRMSATLFGLVGAAVFFLGANTAIYFATGARLALFGVPKSQAISTLRTCPSPVESGGK